MKYLNQNYCFESPSNFIMQLLNIPFGIIDFNKMRHCATDILQFMQQNGFFHLFYVSVFVESDSDSFVSVGEGMNLCDKILEASLFYLSNVEQM